ncbi:enoyl-CoA hydratase/isomerase family protein [Nocardia vaccinii]|uniref:enoyl-CoA hydratase/isomerase family protein n=1 Tax=Nocardia vaccinii TaxID=1822 RepID=UPI000A89B354|nr:enoyl-CoA hydratase-related protein [Nocardia vaccinii]
MTAVAEAAMTEEKPIRIDRTNGVVTITLNRPRRKNALNSAMSSALVDNFRSIGLNPEDRVVVIRGEGDSFCSGGDLTEVHDRAVLTMMRGMGRLMTELRALPQPTVAAVAGPAIGAGWNLALGCDFVIAGAGASFSQAFAKRGMSVDLGGSWLLPRLVGMQKARELTLLGDTISATEAEAYGLVLRVVPDDTLDQAANELALRLAQGSPLALSLTKRLLDESFSHSLEQALEGEARAQHIALGSKNVREALRAFRDRRDPVFGADL